MDLLDRFRGSILGLAVGDALGHPTEFISSLNGIRSRFGPQGVTGFEATGRHPPGTFTDDTQMTIATARAFVRAGHRDLDTLMTTMAEEFVAWSRSPSNNRAPGGTCLSGCRNLALGRPWREAGVRGSKGCGAAMRAAPVGLFHYQDTEALVRVAAAQSALTHGHPTGIASSVAAAAPVAWLARGEGLDGMVAFTRECVLRVSDALLADLACDQELIDGLGVREMLSALDRTEAALDEESDDVCRLLGGAWIGEEAVACALWCVVRAKGDFRESVLRGANSSGDSDSIACIAGSLAGALVGVEGIPPDWVRDVEDGSRLDGLARILHAVVVSGTDVPDPEPSVDFFAVSSPPPSSDVDERDEADESDPTDETDELDPIDEADRPYDESDAAAPDLTGCRFLFAGTLATLSRQRARERLSDLGGSTADTLDPTVTHVVVGQAGDPGPALEEAQRRQAEGHNLTVLDESELLDLLGLGQLGLFS